MSITSLRGPAAVLAALALAASVPPAHAGGHGNHHSRPCFIVPAHWNVGLDGPLPRC